MGASGGQSGPVNSKKVVAGAISHCPTIELGRCGQSMPSEKPEAVLNALRRVVQGHATSAPSGW